MVDVNSSIFIAGSSGLVGSSVLNYLKSKGCKNLITKSHKELDLINQRDTSSFFSKYKPEYVILAAAKVGGIAANINSPTEFLYDNTMIEMNVIMNAFEFNTNKLIFLGSSCIYPRLCEQPMKEEDILTGPFEPTNEGYAIAKVSGLKLCSYLNKQYGTSFITIIPPNLYGPNDNFSKETSHVVAALIRRFNEAKLRKAKEVIVWGSGRAKREFMFIEDLADVIYFLLKRKTEIDVINVGVGYDITIKELSQMIANIVGYSGEIHFDTSKPDGMPRKLVDNSRIKEMGWEPKTSLENGLRKTYEWYLKHKEGNNV